MQKQLHKLLPLLLAYVSGCGQPAIAQNAYVEGKVCTDRGCFLAQGSGVVIHSDNTGSVVLTAAHNIRNASDVTVAGVRADIIAVDQTADLALLRVALQTDHVATLGSDLSTGQPAQRWSFRDKRSTFTDVLGTSDPSIVTGDSIKGDSGGGVLVNRRELAGIVIRRGETDTGCYTRIVPASVCRPFVARYCPPCIPAGTAPAPPVITQSSARRGPPDPADIPDTEKTARIAQLERRLAELERQLKPGPQGERGPAGPAGPPGPRGKDGTDAVPVDTTRLSQLERLAAEPIRIRVIAVRPDGTETLVDEESYPRGTPIVLKMAEQLLMGD